MWTDIETALLQAALSECRQDAIDECIKIVISFKWNDKKSTLIAKLETLKRKIR